MQALAKATAATINLTIELIRVPALAGLRPHKNRVGFRMVP
jgi:hypothetical protein